LFLFYFLLVETIKIFNGLLNYLIGSGFSVQGSEVQGPGPQITQIFADFAK